MRPGAPIVLTIAGLAALATLSACSDRADDVAVTSSSTPPAASTGPVPSTVADDTVPSTPAAGTEPSTSSPVAGGSATTVEQAPGELSAEAQAELGPTRAPETGGESLGPLGGTEVILETEDGTVQIGAGEVPAAASTLPLPDDFDLQLSSETDDALGFSGVTGLDLDTVADFFRVSLPEAGYEVTSDDAPSPVIVLLGVSGSGSVGDIALSSTSTGGGTTVIVSLSRSG